MKRKQEEEQLKMGILSDELSSGNTTGTDMHLDNHDWESDGDSDMFPETATQGGPYRSSRRNNDSNRAQQRGASAPSQDVPIFLRKAYHMIESCPEDICSWSIKGDSFIVKDALAFAEQVIPQFFKHRNFSSFVRQLNFYGFRKIKSDAIISSKYDNKWWEFKQDNFQRGKPHLLSLIKRASSHNPATESEEVGHLKCEVVSLKSKLVSLSDTVERLTMLVNELLIKDNKEIAIDDETMPNKKRKHLSSASSSVCLNLPLLNQLESDESKKSMYNLRTRSKAVKSDDGDDDDDGVTENISTTSSRDFNDDLLMGNWLEEFDFACDGMEGAVVGVNEHKFKALLGVA